MIAIFLAAYGIPVTLHSIFSVVGSSSIANTVSVTPGGVGVNQAANVVALESVTDSATATAYSIGQQVFTTAWNIVFAVIMISWAFGWKGGRQMVKASYIQAKAKAAEEKAQRQERKAARKAERHARRSRAPPRKSKAGMILAGDIGGTNSRLALFADSLGETVAIATYPWREHGGLEEIVRVFLDEHQADVSQACFGVAGPVRDGRTEAVNLAWPVDAESVARLLSFSAPAS